MSRLKKLHSRGKLHHFIHSLSLIKLFLLFLSLYFLTVILFSFIYYKFNSLTLNGEKSIDLSFYDFFYFSLTVQTTVGFGDFAPIGYSRLIFIIQTFISFCLNTLGIGILLSKFLQRKPKIRFPSYLTYDHKNDQLKIWCLNHDRSSLRDLYCSIGIEVKTPNEETKYARYPIAINSQPSYIPSMLGFVIASKPKQHLVKQTKVLTKGVENIFSYNSKNASGSVFECEEFIVVVDVSPPLKTVPLYRFIFSQKMI